jgi:6-phosphofructokinase 1
MDALCATFTTIKRDHIVNLMGRGCTEVASVVGLSTFADVVDMEGQRHTPEQIANVFMANRKKGKTSSFVIMQERKEPDEVAMMMNSAKFLGEVMKFTGDKTIRMTTLGFLQRGAVPSCRDRWLGVLYANKAVELLHEKKYGLGVCTINDEIQTYEVKLADI